MADRNVNYVKGHRFVEYLGKKGISEEEALAIGTAMLKEGLVIKAEQVDYKKKMIREVHGMPMAKYFDKEGFYVWQFEGSQAMRNFVLAVVVIAFVGLVLFPVWPQFAKVGVWYVSMTLLLLLFGFIVVRLVLFLALYSVGIDFWVLPNFFADDLGIMDSFRPLYSYQGPSLKNIRETWPYRLIVVLALLGMAAWVFTQPTEFDVFLAQNRKFVDELYEGTLLADKSHKDKEQSDKLVVPDAATLERELAELEKLEAEEKADLASSTGSSSGHDSALDALVDSAVAEDESGLHRGGDARESDDDEEEEEGQEVRSKSDEL